MSRVPRGFSPGAIGLCLLVVACHPTGVETISDLDVVATAHDATFNFAGATTYSLPTRVMVVGAPDAGIPDRIDPSTEQLILNTLKNQMDAQGYQQVQPTAQFPDLVMTAAVLSVTNITYYYGYWCGYWAYYYPCYPYYPPVVGVSTYTVGTLVVDLAKANTPPTQLNGVWTAVIRGIQTGIKSEDQVRIVNGIGQAFIQSPYLGRP